MHIYNKLDCNDDVFSLFLCWYHIFHYLCKYNNVKQDDDQYATYQSSQD